MIHCLHEKFLPLLVLSSQGCPDGMHCRHVIVWFLLGTTPPSPLRCHDRPASWNEPQPCKSDALSACVTGCWLYLQHRHVTHHEIWWFSPSPRIPVLFPSSLFPFLIKCYLSQFFYSSPLRTTYHILPSSLNSIYYFIPISLIPCTLSPVLFIFLVPFLFLPLPSVFTSIHKIDRSLWLGPWHFLHEVASQHCYTCARLHGVTSQKILPTAWELTTPNCHFLPTCTSVSLRKPNSQAKSRYFTLNPQNSWYRDGRTLRVGRSRNAGWILGRGNSRRR